MGKNVLIIGASGEIGNAIAEHLAKEGYQLLLHYNKNRRMIDQLRAKTPEESVLSVMQADLRNETETKRFLTQLVFPIDHIIFASGTAQHGLFQDTKEETMDDMLMLHVKMPWLVTKHLLPSMIQKNAGKIIFITSIWGDVGASNEVVYSSVKGAQNTFVKALAKEVGPSGISVNAVSPGFIETKMNQHLSKEEKAEIISDIPMQRAGQSEEIAHVVKFLLDKKSNYIHGEILSVTGGW
ncbi:elongation factor P 5-aminopentanone reductase [Virgibacillus ainsalahensis]